ncbi:sugar transferase [Campylobacter lari]|nr:sugar transferase [Campylobacter lari]MPB47338.1 sugar transferase [Campylobacter lari]
METCCLNWFVEFFPFKYKITSKTICYCDNSMKAFYQGLSQNKKEYLDKIDLVAFFLACNDGEFYEDFKDYNVLQNMEICIDKKYNFNYIIPNVENYKKGIDEYCRIMDKRKLKVYQDRILKLESKINNFNFKNLAKQRIQNQLSYKLGQAIIANSKSLLGYIRMPFVLSYIKDKHKQEQKIYQEKIKKDPSLALPPLESYPDYEEALKEKECLTYKLGEALIKANKTWYKGGYVKMWFEIRELKRKIKKK